MIRKSRISRSEIPGVRGLIGATKESTELDCANYHELATEFAAGLAQGYIWEWSICNKVLIAIRIGTYMQ